MWHITLIEWKIKSYDNLNACKKALNIQHSFMIKTLKLIAYKSNITQYNKGQ